MDSTQLRVRRIRPDGVVDTVFNGHELADSLDAPSNPRAVAVDDSRGAVYVADAGANRIWVIREAGTQVFAGTGAVGLDGDGGPAAQAELDLPTDLAVGADGTVYIADMANHRIRAVGPDGIIRTVAGELSPDVDCNVAMNSGALFLPQLIAAAPDGFLYVVDRQGRRLQLLSAQGSASEVESPGIVTGLGVSSDGILTIASGGRLYQQRSGQWSPLASADGEDSALTFNAETVGPGLPGYRSRDHRLAQAAAGQGSRAVGGNGTIGRFGDGGPANGASFTCHDIAVAGDGRILFSDPFNQRIALVNTDGSMQTYAGLADNGDVIGGIAIAPMGIALGANQRLYVADYGHHRIDEMGSDGVSRIVAGNGTAGFAGDGGPAIGAMLDAPFDVAVAASGEVFISDSKNRRVRRVDAQGTIATIATLEFEPGSLVVEPTGGLLVAERNGSALVAIDLQHGFPLTPLNPGVDGTDAIPGRRIGALAIGGNDSFFIVANGELLVGALPLDASSAQRFTPMGSLRALRTVSGMTIDADGNLLLCDEMHRRILRIPASALDQARGPRMAGSGGST